MVLAERGAHRHLANWAGATAYTVKKVYRGSMLAGQRFEVFGSVSDYRATGSRLETPAGAITLDRETILILGVWDPSRSGMQSWLPLDTPSLTVITERFLAGGRVFLLEEGTFISDKGAFPSVGTLGPIAEFEAHLRDSIRKVERFSRATRLTDPIARRDAILALIPPRDHPLETGDAPLSSEGSADRIRQRALELFTGWGDLDAALEVAARSGEGLGFHFQCPIPVEQLLAAARREDVPSHRRTAALYLLARSYPTGRKEGLDEVEALLRCKNIEVKRAAAYLLAQALRIHALNPRYHPREESLPIAKALLSAWREEPDTAFRLAILRESEGSIFSQTLTEEDRRPGVLLLWELRGDRLAVLGASVDGTPFGRRKVSLVASPLEGNGKDRRATRVDGAQLLFSSSSGGEAFRIRFDPPLEPGSYRMWLEIGDDEAHVFRTDIKEIQVQSGL